MIKELTKNRLQKAIDCLIDNGVDKDECMVVLQALCYILLDEEIDNILSEE